MIDTSGWKEFRVGDVFECKTTKPYIFDDVIEGETPYITRTAENNGCDAYIAMDPEYLNKGQCITIGAEGMYAFYQPEDFIAGVKVYTLRNKHMTEKSGLMVCTILNQEIYKYSYGRARILDKVKNEIIKLPATPSGKPDWQYMEDFMRGGHCEPITTSVKSSHLPLEMEKWGEFKLGNIFQIEIAKSSDIGSLDEGDVKFLGRTDTNNGVQGFVNVDESKITSGKCITVSMVGTNVALWQPEEFAASQNIATLRNVDLEIYNALFICALLNMDMKQKYSYGRTVSKEKLQNTIIKLPISADNSPDWKFMENYVKSLAYSDRIGENPVGRTDGRTDGLRQYLTKS